MNLEEQWDCTIQPPTTRLLSTNLALFFPLPDCSCSRPLAWRKRCCYSGCRTYLRGTLCSTVLNSSSASSSFLLTALPTPETATSTRAAPVSVLAHPTPQLHRTIFCWKSWTSVKSPVDGAPRPEIAHLDGQREQHAAQDSFHMEWQELISSPNYGPLQLWQSHMPFFCLSSLKTKCTS